MTTETDTRPLHSESAEWMKQKSISFADRMDALFDELWKEVEAESVAALKRGERLNGAEAQNDALSVFGQVAAYPIVLLMGKIGELKGCPPTIAAQVALEDVTTRFTMSLESALAEGGRPLLHDMAWAAREWLLGHADLQRCAQIAEEEVNALIARLNARTRPDHPQAINTGSNMVAQTLIARGMEQVAGDWLAMESGMDGALAKRAVRSIMDKLPDQLVGESLVDPEIMRQGDRVN